MKASTTSLPPRNKKTAHSKHRPLLRLWAVLVWLLIWQIAAQSFEARELSFLLPSPVSVAKRFFELVLTSDFRARAVFSSLRVMLGMLLGAATGVLLGMAAYFVSAIKTLLQPPVAVIRATPVASFIIIALVWLSDAALGVFIAFLICFPVFYSNTLAGLGAADRQLLEMAHTFRLPFFKRLRVIYMPSLLPHVSSALESAVGLAWKSGTAAEVIAIPKGSIGAQLYRAKVDLATVNLLAWTLAIVMLSAAFAYVFRLLARLAARRWGETGE
ncbi:MAG: ABC transporter permease subunit [Clostridia bacterium]|nr:ABC transporter permease subunit [Clostridia bacterium]